MIGFYDDDLLLTLYWTGSWLTDWHLFKVCKTTWRYLPGPLYYSLSASWIWGWIHPEYEIVSTVDVELCHEYCSFLKPSVCLQFWCQWWLPDILWFYTCRLFQEESAILQENLSQSYLYLYNQTYWYLKANGYEENNAGNMSCDSTYCTCLTWCVIHTLCRCILELIAKPRCAEANVLHKVLGI